MQGKLKLLYLIFVFCFLNTTSAIYTLKGFAEESLNIDLTKELKNGNFLIGLEKHLGSNYISFSGKKNIIFTTKNNFLKLQSFNGLIYKSKKINIIFKKMPLEKPYRVERLVFGPFASYESAQTLRVMAMFHSS